MTVAEQDDSAPNYAPDVRKMDIEVPYTVTDSFKFYFSGKPLGDYETDLLSNLPFFPNPGNNRRSEIINTTIDSKDNYIHEFYVENTLPAKGGEEPPEIVLIHGYGAALGFFYTNFEALTSIPGTKLHAVDLLGFGLSSRPDFPKLKGDTIEDVEKTEGFFIDSLEQWRIKRGIKGKFIIMAHSLGGYLVCPYYLKYGKGRVSKMVMISPVGVERSDLSLIGHPERENGDKRTLDEQYNIARDQGVDLSREISGRMRPDTDDSDALNDDFEDDNDFSDNGDRASIATDASDNEITELMTQVYGRVQPGKFIAGLWEKNCSPLQIIRMMGPFAAKATSVWTWRRFARVDNEQQIRQINNYTTKIFLAKGSGEYGLTRILAPGALAKLPLLDRMPENLDIDTLWLYGQYDWMSKRDGYKICNEINQNNKGKPQGHARFRVISDAGHHVYVDNGKDFEYQVLKFIRGE
ncbi:DEKNAAC100039 [Brettanomyces naardenensis]|uniref:DEKNAAC100039 n=1 Tax=Brettanomyces naardenensis TaxID=13370 RepID=A0A448YGP0_BRENA|nr:DEKNAAC100039 [Brettanomyces naardenensis]